MPTRKLKFLQGFLAENPIGYHIQVQYGAQELLGEVVNVYREEGYTHSLRLQVRHFNGEDWPLEPVPSAVEVFVQEATETA